MMSLGCWGSERRSHHGQDVRFAKADGTKSYLSVLIIPKSEAWRSGLSEYTLHPAACFSRGLWEFPASVLHDSIPVGFFGCEQRKPLVNWRGRGRGRWSVGSRGRWEGRRSGTALGSGTVYSLLRSDRAKSPGRDSPRESSCACTLAREGLVSGHQNCPHPGRDNSFTEDEVTTQASWETGSGITWET